MGLPATEQNLINYFSKNGLLLCNENRFLPSLSTAGGDWNAITALIERREVFYSKLYRGRVTYLSREGYYQLKPLYQKREGLSAHSLALLDLLAQHGPLGTRELKLQTGLAGKELSALLDPLFARLLVTAVCRDKTLAPNWSTFLWGSFSQWEKDAAPPAGASAQLFGLLTEKERKKLLRK